MTINTACYKLPPLLLFFFFNFYFFTIATFNSWHKSEKKKKKFKIPTYSLLNFFFTLTFLSLNFVIHTFPLKTYEDNSFFNPQNHENTTFWLLPVYHASGIQMQSVCPQEMSPKAFLWTHPVQSAEFPRTWSCYMCHLTDFDYFFIADKKRERMK